MSFWRGNRNNLDRDRGTAVAISGKLILLSACRGKRKPDVQRTAANALSPELHFLGF